VKDLIFACLLGPGESESEAFRLARSIRTFGGEFCFNPIWMFSQTAENDLPQATQQELFSLGLRLITFDVDPAAGSFPFAAYVTAAGLAESLSQGEASFLAFMASDTLVLQPPYEFRLSTGKILGACPVHLKLLGSGINEPLDDFWKLIYHHSRVDPEKVFTLQTVVDAQAVRAYINAGLLVVRPERGLLRAWQASFDRQYLLPEYEAFYGQNELYKIFMHQAVLAGSLLSLLNADEFQAFPAGINYPLHLHSRMAPAQSPTDLSQLVTCRYEDYAEFMDNTHRAGFIHIDESMTEWLTSQL